MGADGAARRGRRRHHQLHVGSLVYDVDYRHPVIHAKGAATIQLLSGGRHEFGIGAGWMQTDYDEAGMTYDRPGTAHRAARRGAGDHPQHVGERAHQLHRQALPDHEHRAGGGPAGRRPKILIGGGGPRVPALAGRHADIVGINPTLIEGKVTARTAADLAPERVDEKLRWVREGAEAAGRRFATSSSTRSPSSWRSSTIRRACARRWARTPA